MGVYLSNPVKDKVSSNEENAYLKCGASSMQGWRMSQEDAHNCCLNFDSEVSLFAVYDGHGGAEVAEYAAKCLPETIKGTNAYKLKDFEKALVDAFLEFDATLITDTVLEELKKIAGSKDQNNATSETEDEEDEDDVQGLREEAGMPLADVIARYANGTIPKTPALRRIKGESSKSPYLKARHPSSASDPEVSSSSSSGSNEASGSTEGNGSNEAGVSSEGNGSNEAGVSSEGNGSNEASVSSEGNGSNEAGVSNKTSSKDEAAGSNKAVEGTAEVITNGISEETTGEESSNGETAVESISIKKGDSCEVSSSSAVNGESPKNSTSGRLSAKRARTNMFRSLLAAIAADAEDESDSDDNDENFSANADTSTTASSDEDAESEDVEENGDAAEDEEEETEEEGEEEEDEEEEEDTNCQDIDLTDTEEPGKDSGCTAVVSLVTPNRVIVANAGDSRAVLSRKGEAIDLSVDHKPEDPIELARIVAAGGRITPDGRVNGGLNLSRALGDHMYKKASNLPATEQMITALPDIKSLELREGEDEFIVLACDGIWNSMSSQEVVDFIRPLIAKGEKLSDICEKLFDSCLAEHTLGDGTGCDNMTCVIVQLFPSVNCYSSKRKSEEVDSSDGSKRVKVNADEGET